MADRVEPPVAEALMALLAGAAPLFERAKAAGIFRTPPINATPEPAKPAAPPEPPAAASDAQKTALQEIIVAQATKIVALEAEIARLRA